MTNCPRKKEIECKNTTAFVEGIKQCIEKLFAQAPTLITGIILGVIANIISACILGVSETGYAVVSVLWPILILIIVLVMGVIVSLCRLGFPYLTFFLVLIIVSLLLMGFIVVNSFVRVPQLLLLPDWVATDILYDSNLDAEMTGHWKGYVVRQRPKARKIILKGKKVQLRIDRFEFDIQTLNNHNVVGEIARIQGHSYPFKSIPGAKLYMLVKDRSGRFINHKMTGPFQTMSDTDWEVSVQVGERDDTGMEFDITASLSLCDFGKERFRNEDIPDINPCGNTRFSDRIEVKRQ